MCPTERNGKIVLDNNLERLKEAFAVLDKDGDGIIATSDLESLLQGSVACRLMSKKDVRSMLAVVGGNGVNLEQFLRLVHFEPMSNVCAISGDRNDEKDLNAMFRALDKNGDGFVCRGDLETVMKKIGRRSPEKDISGMLQCSLVGTVPEKVTYEEFAALMAKSRPTNGFEVLRHVEAY